MNGEEARGQFGQSDDLLGTCIASVEVAEIAVADFVAIAASSVAVVKQLTLVTLEGL